MTKTTQPYNLEVGFKFMCSLFQKACLYLYTLMLYVGIKTGEQLNILPQHFRALAALMEAQPMCRSTVLLFLPKNPLCCILFTLAIVLPADWEGA